MADSRLYRRLGVVVERLRRLRSLHHGTVGWLALAALLLILAAVSVDRMTFFTLFAIGAIGVFVWSHLAFRPRRSDERDAALLIERQFPELDARLLTAIQQKPQGDSWQFGFLQSEVLTEVLDHAQQKPWEQTVPTARTATAWLANATAMLTCVAMALFVTFRPTSPAYPTAMGQPQSRPSSLDAEFAIEVEPGNAEIERGTSLLVLARFPVNLPSQVELVAVDDQQQERRIPLRKSLDDPLFGGRIPHIERNLAYRLEYDGRVSDTYSVTTFEYPVLVKADAHVDAPEYTGLERKTIEDVRRVSIVEGSTLQLDCALNKPVRSATLIDEEGQRLGLSVVEGHAARFSVNWMAEEPQQKRFRLELVDDQGRVNRHPEEFIVHVSPNLPADLKVTFPKRDTRVSQLEELVLQAAASDDFGLLEYGLVYQAPDGSEETVVLGDQAARDEKKSLDHLLAMSSLQVEPDQLVSYYFYADDVGPDGQPRRAFSDMFFAEVRPFEEIFRQAPGQEGQEGQQQNQDAGEGGPSQRLVELQRQIVTATWNIIRKERRDPPTSSFEEDVTTLFESQVQVRELAEEMAGELTDPLMQQYAAEAIEHMGDARREFSSAVSDHSIETLPLARTAAQAAYQALLRLNSREKLVQENRSQSQSSSSSSAQSRMNQQLNELELKNDRNRYQTERQAQQQQEAAERETLQVLNRLRELARRQEDLNQKIRELENKLRAAQTDEERRDLERQLKRLQEEQQEMLRNLDELRQRMDQEQNRQQMADAREQVDQTRERVFRAAEALQEGQTSQALTEGTRAQRELEELREDFRKRTAGQFDDRLRQLREEVRELAERQEQVGRKLRQEQPAEPSQRPSLRGQPVDDRQELVADLDQQRDRLRETLDRTRELVEESETAEPLLSKKLYDTMRDLRKQDPEEALSAASQLTRHGIRPEARRAEEQAREGINRLRQGVNEAARAILGDESEALRQAQSELQRLTDAVRQELAQNDEPIGRESRTGESGRSGDEKSERDAPSPTQADSGNGERTDGEPRERTSGQETASGLNSNDAQPSQSEQQPAGPPQPGSPMEGSRPGERPGPAPMEQSGQPGQQPGQSGQNQSSGSPSPQETPGQQQSDQQSAGAGESSPPSDSFRGGRPTPQSAPMDGNRSQQPRSLRDQLGAFFEPGGTTDGGGSGGTHLPLTGDAYLEWSDRMRDVEEMLTSPELRAEAAAIRERARQMRIDIKRHSKQPNWELVRTSIYGPLLQLQDLVAEELARREPNEQLVPIDRDPVPDRYADLVRQYYEELSRQP